MSGALRDRILGAITDQVDQPLPDDVFNQLAGEVFRFQYERIAAYRAYCERRGRTPATVTHWTEIPAVPTAAFKEVPLVTTDPHDVELVFRTSGTTQGAEKRGAHYIVDPGLYHAALLPMFRAYLLPDGARLPFLSLIPRAALVPDSSLSHMIDVVEKELATNIEYFVDPVSGLQVDLLVQRLDALAEPVCLVGTSFAFVHLLDALAAAGKRYRLPAGSRLMDTGGFKGRSRSVAAEELRRGYADRLGIAETHAINEYGMTELCSQFYDTTLRDLQLERPLARVKVPAPWVRTRVVDAETLQPVAQGVVGLLQHFDLANLHSVLAIQTEDLGREGERGFEVRGRVAGAPPRGCSIAMDLLLEATRGR